MSCIAEFGIIDNFEKNKEYSEYEPQKYNCIGINDDFLNDWWKNLVLIPTYFISYDKPNIGLNRWGVTLIPPKSLESLYNIISNDRRASSSKELIDLMGLIRKAIDQNKYVIHYGVW